MYSNSNLTVCMNSTNSISIANTQMQLINCLEAVNSYCCHNNWLINGNLSERRNKQIEDFYNSHYLGTSFGHYINLRLFKGGSKICFWMNLLYSKIVLSLILLFRKMDYVFIGHYLNPIHRFIIRKATFKNNNCRSVLVDDGTGTMLFAKERYIEQTNEIDRCEYDRSMKAFFSPSPDSVLIPSVMEYFTIYPVNQKLEKDHIRKNLYQVVKSWANSSNFKILPNTMVFVGQTLVEEGIVSLEKFQQYLNQAFTKAKEKYGIGNIIYCPHPGESSVEQKLEIFSNLLIHRNKEPFELFALSFPKSCCICGFTSSSLWNLSYFSIDASIKFVHIKDCDIICKEPMKSHMANIYKTYSESKTIEEL